MVLGCSMSLCGLCLQPVDVAGSGWALAEECSYALTFSSLPCPPFGRTEPFAGTGVPVIIAMGGVPQPGLTVPTSRTARLDASAALGTILGPHGMHEHEQTGCQPTRRMPPELTLTCETPTPTSWGQEGRGVVCRDRPARYANIEALPWHA
jgi:hypothetical protein